MPPFAITILDNTALQLLHNIQHNMLVEAHGAFQNTGAEMKEYSQSICPVRTGFLRSSIYFKMLETLSYEFGAEADYALFVEMGTRFMAAQPFIRPAVEAYTSVILQAVIDAVMKAIRT